MTEPELPPQGLLGTDHGADRPALPRDHALDFLSCGERALGSMQIAYQMMVNGRSVDQGFHGLVCPPPALIGLIQLRRDGFVNRRSAMAPHSSPFSEALSVVQWRVKGRRSVASWRRGRGNCNIMSNMKIRDRGWAAVADAH